MNNLERFLDSLKENIISQEPQENHEKRFLKKLKAQKRKNKSFAISLKRVGWVAAVLLIGLFSIDIYQKNNQQFDLASTSKEMGETQHFFQTVINNYSQKLNKINSDWAQETLSNAWNKIELLEKDYKKLQSELSKSGNDPKIIMAMIKNYQTRIYVLQNVLDNIEDINYKKQTKYESI